jgi:hypothetical protein
MEDQLKSEIQNGCQRRLFEHEINVHLYLLWILQTWMDSFEIWHAGYNRVWHNRECK